MKKIIIAILLLLIANISVFSYKNYIKNKKYKRVEFSEILNKNFIYILDGKKTDITITFLNDGVYGFTGINKYFAGYKLGENGQIEFSPIGTSMIDVPQNQAEMEKQYFNLLGNVNKIETFEEKIVLFTRNNNKLKFVINKNYQYNKNDFDTFGPKTQIDNIELKNNNESYMNQ